MTFKPLTISVLWLALATGICLPAHAQGSLSQYRGEASFNKGMELFEAGHFTAARRYFADVLQSRDTLRLHWLDARFYDAACGVRTGEPGAVETLERLTDAYPDYPGMTYACLQLANAAYRDENYAEALSWFDRVNPSQLLPEDRPAFYYRSGYAARMDGNLAQSCRQLAVLTDGASDYAEVALLYYAVNLFDEGRCDEAMAQFERLDGSPAYGTAASYYISHIYLEQGLYDKVVDYTRNVMVTDTTYREGLYRVVAAAYSRLGQPDKALVYWNAYCETAAEPSLSDNYEIGNDWYTLQRYDTAIPYLEKAAADTAAVGQYAAYRLAACCLKTGDKPRALAAFHAAAECSADTVVQEDARFQEAVLGYDLSYGTVADIIRRFESYLERYPDGLHTQDAYNYLVTAYGETRNYAAVLEMLQNADQNVGYVGAAYQRAAFFRAVELLGEGDAETAAELLAKSASFKQYDYVLAVRTLFWQAEAAAAAGDHAGAAALYKQFMASEDAGDMAEYPYACYGLGYCYFAQKSHEAAETWFSRFIEMSPSGDPAVNDAKLRLADCRFMQKQYAQAAAAYAAAAASASDDAGYALFQEAFCEGLQGHHEKKASLLSELLGKWPGSDYADDALYETGRAYVALQRPGDAVASFRKVAEDFPLSTYRSKALNQAGLTCYNMNDTERAMAFYRKVVEEYPNTPEARSALRGIQTLYVDRNDADAYFTYVASLENQHMTVTVSEQDSLTYTVAEKQFMVGRTEAASKSLQQYLERYPEGAFALPAHYYLAECLRGEGKDSLAAVHYRPVADAPRNVFSEQALAAVSDILLAENRCEDALGYYKQLASLAEIAENKQAAALGIVKCLSALGRYAEVTAAAEAVRKQQKAPQADVRQAGWLEADAWLQRQDTLKALALYKDLSAEALSDISARANYEAIRLMFAKKQYKEAEEAVFDFSQKKTSQTVWTARSFIILGRIYVAQDDLFQARHTIQSVIDNYAVKDDGVIDEAAKVLAQIESLSQTEERP